MTQGDEFAEIQSQDIGLDRSNYLGQGDIQIPEPDLAKECDNTLTEGGTAAEEEDEKSSAQRLVSSIKEKKHNVGAKVKEVFNIEHTADNSPEIEPGSTLLAGSAEKRSDSRLLDTEAPSTKETLKNFVHHPYDTVKSKVSDQGKRQVAAHVGVKDIPHGQDVDIVKASIALGRAETEKQKLLASDNLSELLRERQNSSLRWTLERHVTKVRRMPCNTLARQPKNAFEQINSDGKVSTNWKAYSAHLLEYLAHWYGGQYIGYGSEPPTPSQQALVPNMERMIVVTSPFQEIMMAVRRVYCWDKPLETLRYLVLFIVLWYSDLLLSGLLFAILYKVVNRKLCTEKIEDLRKEVERREELEESALSLTGFVDKHGEKDWADEMLQSIGPWIMVQLGDLADLFECAINFYEWRNPRRTVMSLSILAICLVITTFTPAWLLMKSSTLCAGMTFFGLRPIAVRYPDYRLLVSPWKRLFWNIPTRAEWAIQLIQAQGRQYREDNEYGSDSEQPHDCSSYKAQYNKTSGEIIVSTKSIRFKSTIERSTQFDVSYAQIDRLEKHDCILRKHLPTRLAADMRRDMKFVVRTGEDFFLTDVNQRDVAFSQIIGFSENNWQVVW